MSLTYGVPYMVRANMVNCIILMSEKSVFVE